MYWLTILLGATAAILQGGGYLLYNIQMDSGRSNPNPATWGIWAFLTVVNALTFQGMTNVVVALQFFSGSVACLITFSIALVSGKFSWPKPKEWILLWFGVVGAFVWLYYRSAVGGNMIVFGTLIISFIPTYEGVLRDPRNEVPLAWIVWTLAYVVTTTNVITNWNNHPLSLVVPIGGSVLHCGIAALCTKRRKQFQSPAG